MLGVALPSRSKTTASPSRLRAAGIEVLLLALLFGLALAVRAPFFLEMPGLTDEIEEWELAVRAYEGKLVLVGVNPWIGAMHSYLLAAGWSMFGRDPVFARVLSLVAGALTIPATYVLGREVHSRLAGLLTALLAAVSGFHILINSHVGWSSCLTPLFTTAACVSLARALRGSGVALAATGLLFGLAMQTHLLGLLLLPGALVLAVARQPRLVRSRWGTLAAALLVLLSSTFVWHNVRTDFSAIERIEARSEDKGGMRLEQVPGNLVAQLRNLGLVLSGVVPLGGSAGWEVAAVPLAIVLVAMVQQARQGNLLPLAVVAPAVVLLSLASEQTLLPLQARYITPIALVSYAAVGGLLAELVARARAPNPRRVIRGAVSTAVVAVLVLASAYFLPAYYARSAWDLGTRSDVPRAVGRSGELFAITRSVATTWSPGYGVVVDAGIPNGPDDRARQALLALLRISDIPYDVVRVDAAWAQRASVSGWLGLAAVSCQNLRLIQDMHLPTVSPVSAAPVEQCFHAGLLRFGSAP